MALHQASQSLSHQMFRFRIERFVLQDLAIAFFRLASFYQICLQPSSHLASFCQTTIADSSRRPLHPKTEPSVMARVPGLLLSIAERRDPLTALL